MEILIVILVVILVAAFYLLLRNDKVCDFQIEISHKCCDVLINFLESLKDDEEFNERYEEYEQLKMKKDEILPKHSYCSMLFSLKPLKLEHWYTKEEIEFMNLKFISKRL